ncbi:uncharacterized protein LOC107820968 isoform X3 [Nicotiana tabacum]|uniref:Uncharacterized protein LOC107820968 isoform X3 n=1 Tax=Nicotiana tabacum TaxID=4097 RepID=A0AC58TCP8_TOBAC
MDRAALKTLNAVASPLHFRAKTSLFRPFLLHNLHFPLLSPSTRLSPLRSLCVRSDAITMPNEAGETAVEKAQNKLLQVVLVSPQELFTGKVKAIGKEDDGLYILRSQAAGNRSEVTLTATESSASYDFSSVEDIDLWHRRFGHVSANVLRKLLPIKLELIAEKVNKCAVCPCAKQTRQLFPTSCIKTTASFDLVHVDLWDHIK